MNQVKGKPFRESRAWTRSETIALALHTCAQCHGAGLRVGRRGGSRPCDCVFRSVFRICLNRVRAISAETGYISRATFSVGGGGNGGGACWSRLDEEFVADFYLSAKRVLKGIEWDVFRLHVILGADSGLCMQKLGIDRGRFYHTVYRVERKAGREFAEMQPYALWPVDEYFTYRRALAPLAAGA